MTFSAVCSQCDQPWDERTERIGKPAADFDSCAFRCHACGVAFSNARRPASRIRITRTPHLNVPPEAHEGLDAALDGACNIGNRTVKRQKFCSANSEDAVTWTVVRGLLEVGRLGALVGQPALGPPQALLLWGHPAAGPAADDVSDRLAQMSDDLGEKPDRRSEPDVIALWPSQLAVVEAKYGSSNDRHPNYAGYSTYLPVDGLFAAPDEAVEAEGSYQLARNWIIGAAIANALRVPLRLVNLGPAAIAGHAAAFGALLAQTPDRSFEHRRWQQVLEGRHSPAWLEPYALHRGLHSA
jgi:hypothetical protein